MPSVLHPTAVLYFSEDGDTGAHTHTFTLMFCSLSFASISAAPALAPPLPPPFPHTHTFPALSVWHQERVLYGVKILSDKTRLALSLFLSHCVCFAVTLSSRDASLLIAWPGNQCTYFSHNLHRVNWELFALSSRKINIQLQL